MAKRQSHLRYLLKVWSIRDTIPIVPERKLKEVFFYEDKVKDDVGFPISATSTSPSHWEKKRRWTQPLPLKLPRKRQGLCGRGLRIDIYGH